jgi:3-phosphoshikimate 1-carboxyvinyltransferase
MKEEIRPAAGPLSGRVRLPGDKSISHRYAMLASVASGASRIHNYSSGADCHSTLGCLRSLGVPVGVADREVTIEGVGLQGYCQPSADLDAGNSGSTIRMLSGLLAGQPIHARLIGDESLSRRPMERIMKPLAQMGARLEAREGKFPPLEIRGGALTAIDYTMPVPSAQVKSCLLLAGLNAEGETVVRESAKTRDHTEVALREMGADIETGRGWVKIRRATALQAKELTVPGDLSSAAFFLVAAAIVPDSQVVIEGVGLNPSRATLIDFLVAAGVEVRVLDLSSQAGEPVGNLMVRGSRPRGGTVEGAWAAALIDELPVLAVLGAASRDGLLVKDAAELRVKETDRIETLAHNFRRLGLEIETRPDGFFVPGGQQAQAAELDSFSDHRIAMAGAVAALRADGPCLIEGAEAASVSFPEFWDTLRQLSAGG